MHLFIYLNFWILIIIIIFKVLLVVSLPGEGSSLSRVHIKHLNNNNNNNKMEDTQLLHICFQLTFEPFRPPGTATRDNEKRSRVRSEYL